MQVRRQDDIAAPELLSLTQHADEWRAGEVERGFSMALGRSDDPADGRIVHVTARDADGALVGLLSFVPWGRGGLSSTSCDARPAAPSGVTELMVSELMARARSLGISRVSLNFCLFRGIFDDANRLGSRPLTRFNASMLGLFDRFWQLERLHRATQKYEPQWAPRFLCHDDAVALAAGRLAAGAAEGFIPWPHRRSTTGSLDEAHLREAVRIDEAGADAQSLEPRRSDQFRHRLGTLERLRRDGSDAYPVGAGQPSTSHRGDRGRGRWRQPRSPRRRGPGA